MNCAIKKADGRYYCLICEEKGTPISYTLMENVHRHRRRFHGIMCDAPIKKQKVTCKPKQQSEEISSMNDMMNKVFDMMGQMHGQMKILQEQVATSKTPVVVNNNNITQNVNIYFNKDLKYYPELVKLLGKKETWDYLLFTMPESKDMFGVIDKLFTLSGNCPIKVDGDSFIVFRGESDHVMDATGELIDKENKTKLKDAVMSAYIESTKDIAEKCDRIRVSRVNGSYTEADEEILARRFDSTVEPSRPHEIIEMISSYKPKKKDFDRLRKICPQIVKKTVYGI